MVRRLTRLSRGLLRMLMSSWQRTRILSLVMFRFTLRRELSPSLLVSTDGLSPLPTLPRCMLPSSVLTRLR
uniref:Uncharacterized protein n=1 Tax=Brassica campestris TaxID=3711 RepID=A0A3P6BYK5_BRACM|nr:unnamed protein product [Brassica rapa]